MRLSRTLAQFAQARFFEDIPQEIVTRFLDGCSAHEASDNQIILRQGAAPEGMALIVEGAVKVALCSGRGDLAILHHAKHGEVIGCLEAIAGQPMIANCSALGNVAYLWCPVDMLTRHMADPLFRRNAMRAVWERLQRDSELKLIDQTCPLDRRICAYLLHLSDASDIVIQNQSYLAVLTSSSRQSINRALALLRKDGLISVERGVIRLLDRAGLQRRLAGN